MSGRRPLRRPPPPNPMEPPSDSAVPWLMLPLQDYHLTGLGGMMTFYSISEKRNFSVYFPPKLEKFPWISTLNSSGDRLMAFDSLSNLHILDPLTGDSIDLPPLSTFPGVQLHSQATGSAHYTFPGPDGRKVVTKTVENAGKAYLKKAVVGWTTGSPSSASSDDSPNQLRTSSYTVMAICGGLSRRLAFMREGDSSWKVSQTLLKLRDIMYHDGCFYALDYRGGLSKVKIVDSVYGGRFSVEIEILVRQGGCKRRCHQRYLARLPDGKICQVLRIGERVRSYFTTYRFEVYELTEGGRWGAMHDLGGYSIFVGQNDTVSVSPPAVEGNCIYFTDDYFQPSQTLQSAPPLPNSQGKTSYTINDVGIFNLEKGSFNTYYPHEYKCFYWPRAIWFMPDEQTAGKIKDMARAGQKHSVPKLKRRRVL